MLSATTSALFIATTRETAIEVAAEVAHERLFGQVGLHCRPFPFYPVRFLTVPLWTERQMASPHIYIYMNHIHGSQIQAAFREALANHIYIHKFRMNGLTVAVTSCKVSRIQRQ